jgi:hypothetical protein
MVLWRNESLYDSVNYMQLSSRGIAALSFLVVTSTIGIWLATMPLLERRSTQLLQEYLQPKISALLVDSGISISYESIIPGFFNTIHVRNLRIRSNDQTLIDIPRLSISYDWQALLSGMLPIRQIQVLDPVITFDLQRDALVLDHLMDMLSTQNGLTVLASTNIRLIIKRMRAMVQVDDAMMVRTVLRRFDGLLEAAGAMSVSASGHISAMDTDARLGLKNLSLPFVVTTRFVRDLSRVEALLHASMDSDAGRLSAMDYRISKHDDSISLSTTGFGIQTLTGVWHMTASRISLDVELDDFIPARLISGLALDESILRWFGTGYTGTASLTTDLSLAGSRASIRLAGSIPRQFTADFSSTVNNPVLAGVLASASSFSIMADGSYDLINIQSVRLRNQVLDVNFSGEFRPAMIGLDGLVEARYSPSTSRRLDVRAQIFGAGTSWFAYTPFFDFDGSVFRDVNVSIDYVDQTLVFQGETAIGHDRNPGSMAGHTLPADLPVGSSSLELYDAAPAGLSRLTIEGRLAIDKNPYIEAALHVNNLYLADIGGAISGITGKDPRPLLEPFRIDGDLSFFSDFSQISFSSNNTVIVHDGTTTAFGVFSYTGTNSLMSIHNFDISLGGIPVQGSGSLNYAAGSSIDFLAAASSSGNTYRMAGNIRDGSILVTGDYGLELALQTTGSGLSGTLTLDSLPIQAESFFMSITCRASGSFSAFDDWALVVDHGRIAASLATATATELPEIVFSGTINQSGLNLPTVALLDSISVLNGNMVAAWSTVHGPQLSGVLRLEAADGESYSLEGAYHDGDLSVMANLHRVLIQRWPVQIPFVEGRLDATIDIRGTIEDPDATFVFALNPGARIDDTPYISGEGSYQSHVLSVKDARARYLYQSVEDLSFGYDFNKQALTASALLRIALGHFSASGRIAFNGLAVAGSGDASPEFMVQGTIRGTPDAFVPLPDWPFALEIRRDDYTVTTGPSAQVRVLISKNGDFQGVVDQGLPIAFQATGIIQERAISMDIERATIDLPFLFFLLQLPYIQVVSGTASGSARISGPIRDPEITGSLNLDNMYMTVPDFVPEPIGPFTEPLYFTGRNMEMIQPNLQCGAGFVNASLLATIREYIPSEMEISIFSRSPGQIPLKMRLLGMELSGLTEPVINLSILDGQVQLTGTVLVPSGDVILTSDLVSGAFSGGSGDASSFSMNLDILFGKGVRLYFPTKRLPLVSGQADPSSKLSIAFDGRDYSYKVRGQASLRGGSVFYIQKNFFLKHAVVVFNEDETSFDPIITLEAETRTRNDSGPVLVKLSTLNSRLFNLAFRLDSVPAMSEAEIARMLGLDLVAAKEGEDQDVGRAVGRAMLENFDLVPELNVISIFERGLQDILGLDLFYIRSQVLQRWLSDLSGLSGANRTATLTDYLQDTAVIAGKYIRDDLFLQVAFRLQEDTALAQPGNLRLQSEIGLEWVTPHFVLNWQFRPENPDTLFVTDQSISLFWRIPLK